MDKRTLRLVPDNIVFTLVRSANAVVCSSLPLLVAIFGYSNLNGIATAVSQKPAVIRRTVILDRTQLTFSDRIAISEANCGREFGWQVLSERDEPIATLTEPHSADMFWTAYIVTPLDGHTITQTEGFWHPDCHRIRNIRYPNFVVDTFGHYNAETNRATIRFDYINVDFSWADRLRAPLWFMRRWFK